jgi:4-amino-4-deoxy-L-arabinose transferase-like glycosyltransferase
MKAKTRSDNQVRQDSPVQIWRTRTWIYIAVLTFLSVIMATYGLGGAFQGTFETKGGTFRTSGIGSDRWVENGAEIRIGGILRGVNFLEIKLSKWRPSGEEPAHLRFHLCDKQEGEVLVTEESSYRFKLAGVCTPQTFRIEILNPFRSANSGDNRQLGVQLVSTTVSSKLGVPLVSLSAIALTSAAFLLPAVLLLFSRLLLPALLLPFVFGGILSQALLPSATDVFFVWLLVLLIATGFCIGSRHSQRGRGRKEIAAPVFQQRWGTFIFIIVAAALFRFYGIEFGLPGRFHPDETPKFNAIERMVAFNQWNPQYFLHPSLLLYLSMFLEKIMGFIGVGWDFNSQVRLSGRIVSATAGTLSVGLLYLIGRRLYSRFVGVLAALLLAVMPLHITSSRYMKEDALMVMFLLAVMYLVIVAVQTKKPLFLLAAGVAAGLCVGSKYTGLLASGLLLCSPWLASRSLKPDIRFAKYVILALLLVPLFFFFTTPYSVFDFEHFMLGFMSERKHMLRGHSVEIDAWSQYWMYHARRSLLPGMTSIPFLISFIGVGFFLWRRKVEDLWILGVLLLFLLPAEWVRAKPAPQAERYMFPCLPFLAIICAETLRVLANSRVRKAIPILVVCVLLCPLIESTLLAFEVKNDTRTRAAEWMSSNLPKNARVLVDWVPYVPQPKAGFFQVQMFEPGMLVPELKSIVDKKLSPPFDYLILSSLLYNRFFDQPLTDQVRRSVIREAFEKLPIVYQEEPWHRTYGFHNPAITIFSLKVEDRLKLEQAVQKGDLSHLVKARPWPVAQGLEQFLWGVLGGKGEWQ